MPLDPSSIDAGAMSDQRHTDRPVETQTAVRLAGCLCSCVRLWHARDQLAYAVSRRRVWLCSSSTRSFSPRFSSFSSGQGSLSLRHASTSVRYMPRYGGDSDASCWYHDYLWL